MATEDVLRMCNNVKLKKQDGSLYLLPTRLAWASKGTKSGFSQTHNYSEIKSQKISPDRKPKVQMQIVLVDGGSVTFHFNQSDQKDALYERDAIKTKLQHLLPQFRRQVDEELADKTKIMQNDPELFQLYKKLVVSGIITAGEFWASRQTVKIDEQVMGISASFLGDIRPEADGCSGIKYNLTTDVIEAIFRTYPSVKRKHQENVPDKLSETEFWTRFFQSHYFHRDRLVTSNDLFSECSAGEKESGKTDNNEACIDSFFNITNMVDIGVPDAYSAVDTADEAKSVENKKNLVHDAHVEMIKRFNNHSAMVLNSLTKENPDEIWQSKKMKLREIVANDDLVENVDSGCVVLKLDKKDKYFQGPSRSYANDENFSTEQVINSIKAVASQLENWTPSLNSVLSSGDAVKVLTQLSPGGCLMGRGVERCGEVSSGMRRLHAVLTELLRHFWACFPITGPEVEAKLTRLASHLDNQVRVELEALALEEGGCTYNLESMVEKALGRYDQYMKRKASKKHIKT